MKNISLVVLLSISFFFLRNSDQFGISTAYQVDQTEQLIHMFSLQISPWWEEKKR